MVKCACVGCDVYLSSRYINGPAYKSNNWKWIQIMSICHYRFSQHSIAVLLLGVNSLLKMIVLALNWSIVWGTRMGSMHENIKIGSFNCRVEWLLLSNVFNFHSTSQIIACIVCPLKCHSIVVGDTRHDFFVVSDICFCCLVHFCCRFQYLHFWT